MLVKIKSLINKLSLGQKLSISFIVFGLIIGYISYLLFAAINTHNSIHSLHEMVEKNFYSFIDLDNGDSLSNLVNTKNEKVLEAIRIFKKASSEKLSSFSVYYLDNDHNWKWIYIDRNYYFRSADAPKNLVRNLDHALKRNIVTSSSLFFGQNQTVHVMLNITRKIDNKKYVLLVELYREGISEFIKYNFLQIIGYGIFILIISIGLSRFFTRKLLAPVKDLSSQASKIAEGRFDLRFSADRTDELGVLANSLNTMAMKVESHITEIERRMHAMETMNKIDKAVLSSISRRELLDRVVAIVHGHFFGSAIAIAARNDSKHGFDIYAFYGPGTMNIFKGSPFVSDDELGPLANEAKAVFHLHNAESGVSIPRRFKYFIGSNIGCLLNIPIIIEEEYFGSMLIARAEEHDFFPQEIETAKMLTDQVAVALHSIRAFEERESLFLGILIALTHALDAKSKWSAGHSERVAEYAKAIGREMALDDGDLNMLSISAILHDIGKIGIPESILDKEGKLLEEEFKIMKQHPEKGAEIIIDIEAYDKILPGILYHHERWDGRGYPFGLKENEIPLKSRIIAVADVFDAITADRPYRKGMSREDAINFLRNESEKMFDPAIVGIFIDILLKGPA